MPDPTIAFQGRFDIPDWDTIRCTGCRQYKKANQFYLKKMKRRGTIEFARRSQCIQCFNESIQNRLADPIARAKHYQSVGRWRRNNLGKVNNARLKRKYGITLDDYASLLEAQGGGCAICEASSLMEHQSRRLAVDHCHICGCVRGILCFSCNTGTKWNSIPGWCKMADAYLEAHVCKT